MNPIACINIRKFIVSNYSVFATRKRKRNLPEVDNANFIVFCDLLPSALDYGSKYVLCWRH